MFRYMKYFLSTLSLVALTCSMFAARNIVPNPADLAAFNPTNNAVLCAYFDGPVCNDIVLAGDYNNWNTNPSKMVKMRPVEGFAGWYAGGVTPDANGADKKFKPVQLTADGTFSWDFQCGGPSVWVKANPNGATLDVQAEQGGTECCLHYKKAGAYIYYCTAWKGASPCQEPKDYIINVYPPDCDWGKLTIAGGFDNWENINIPMLPEYDKDGNPYWHYALSYQYPGGAFKIKCGEGWDNPIEEYIDSIGEWKEVNDGKNWILGDEDTIVFYWNDGRYRYKYCKPDFDTAVSANTINYMAEEKLAEVTKSNKYGLHPNAFNVAITSHTFSDGKGTITFAGDITSIGDSAFYGSPISAIAMPHSVTSIGNLAFCGCTASFLDIPKSVTSIGHNAFSGCFLRKVTIPDGVTNINSETFFKCYYLRSITISNGVTNIGQSAFDYCISLTSVTLPNSVRYIEDGAFAACSSLKSVEFSDSLKSIGYLAFYACKLESITIPEGVTSIGGSAFEGCCSLKQISIPKSLKNIGKEAFYYCTAIRTITCLATTPPKCGDNCFILYGPTVYVPNESIDAYKNAATWDMFSYILPISAEQHPTTTVETTPNSYTVTITWPTHLEADSYTIEIIQGGEVVCTLTFNGQGQLINIAFAPGRSGRNDVAEAEAVNGGYKFTITNLSPDTKYTYMVDTKNASGASIAHYTGEFTTRTPAAIDELESQKSNVGSQKMILDGQLMILREGKMYDARGLEAK